MPEKEFTVPLRKAFKQPLTKRTNKMILEIKRFVRKHLRKEGSQVVIDNEVNEFIFKHSSKKPRRIGIQTIERDNKLIVFLKGSKKIQEMEEAKKKEKKGKSEGVEKAKKSKEWKKETGIEEKKKTVETTIEKKQESEKAKIEENKKEIKEESKKPVEATITEKPKSEKQNQNEK